MVTTSCVQTPNSQVLHDLRLLIGKQKQGMRVYKCEKCQAHSACAACMTSALEDIDISPQSRAFMHARVYETLACTTFRDVGNLTGRTPVTTAAYMNKHANLAATLYCACVRNNAPHVFKAFVRMYVEDVVFIEDFFLCTPCINSKQHINTPSLIVLWIAATHLLKHQTPKTLRALNSQTYSRTQLQLNVPEESDMQACM